MAPKKIATGALAHGAVCLNNLNEFLFLGGSQAGLDVQLTKTFKIRHVVCCCADTASHPWPETQRLCRRHFSPLPVAGEDTEAPPEGKYDAWKQGVEAAVAIVEEALHKGQAVLVHDMFGRERAAAVCVAWAVAHKGLSVSVAAERLGKKAKQLDLVPLAAPRIREFLERFAREQAELKEEEEARQARKRKLDEATGTLFKRAKKDPMLAKLCQVGLVLADDCRFPSDDASDDAREMLLAGLSYSLGHPKEERHEYQSEVAAQVGEVLQGIERKQVAMQGDTKAAEGEAQDTIAERTREHDEAFSTLEVAKAEVVAKRGEAEVADMAVLAAEVGKNEGTAMLRKAKKQQEALGKERARHVQLLEGPFAALVEGSWETDKDAQKLVSQLRSAVVKLGAEDSILTAMPLALAAKPPRGSFDNIIVDQLKALIDGNVASTDEGIAVANKDITDGETSVSAAEELLESQRAAASGAQERLRDAEAAQADRAAQVMLAKKALSDADSAFAAKFSAREKADAEAAVLADLLITYQVVLDWSAPEPEPAESKAEAMVVDPVLVAPTGGC